MKLRTHPTGSSQLRRAALILRWAALAPIITGAVYLLVFLPSAPSIAVIQANIETISFDVVVPEMAQVTLRGFALSFETPAAQANLGFKETTLSATAQRRPLCLSGIIVPEPGTRITYKRFGTGPLSVTIERQDGKPAASFEITNGALPPVARQSSWLHLEGNVESDDDSKTKRNCDGDTPTRLPIYGIAELGTELRPVARGEEPSSGVLIEGTIDIFARTIELAAWRDIAPRIYPANTTSITIPPGSRVIEYVTGGAHRQPWSGFIQADEDRALGVKVTTPATRLAIIRPGLGLEPEVLAIGLFTQLSNDPSLVSLQIAAACFFAIFQMLSSTTRWYAARREIGAEPKSKTPKS